MDTNEIPHRQIQPLPSFVRKLPIPRLQEIVAGDPSITSYIAHLYAQEDDKSSEERSSMLVSSRTLSYCSTDSPILQAVFKAYRDAETGEPAPASLAVGELCGMFAAGTSDVVTMLKLGHQSS